MVLLSRSSSVTAAPLILVLVGWLVRVVVLVLLAVGLPVFARWTGEQVAQPGGWLELDLALYRVVNSIPFRPLASLWVALLNEPAYGYLILILILLGYCSWRRRSALPLAALAVAVGLSLSLLATGVTHQAAGSRERPFLQVEEAVTPIVSCDGLRLAATRDASGPTASCDGSPAEIVGLDWRTIWVQFHTFPSGHLRETVVLGVVLVAFWPAAWPYVLAYACIMAFSRIHLGAHYPSDVLVGALLGLWSGGLTVFGLDLLRRALVVLRQAPLVRGAWSWLAVTRVPGRPDLDPLPARVLRAAFALLSLNVTTAALGYASTDPAIGHLHTVLASANAVIFSQVTARFSSKLAPLLYVAFGPGGLYYAALASATVLGSLSRRARPLVVTLFVLLVSVALVFELRWLGALLFTPAPPFSAADMSPLPSEWRGRWPMDGLFPSLHALLAGALAGALAGTRRWLVVPAQVLGFAGAAIALYFGIAWVTDALFGYLLGGLSIAFARYVADQFIGPGGRAIPVASETPVQRLERHVRVARGTGAPVGSGDGAPQTSQSGDVTRRAGSRRRHAS